MNKNSIICFIFVNDIIFAYEKNQKDKVNQVIELL